MTPELSSLEQILEEWKIKIDNSNVIGGNEIGRQVISVGNNFIRKAYEAGRS